MSELQLSLIGAGIALVAAVFAYNKWQERKHRKLAERVFRSDHPDVLLGRPQAGEQAGPERIEPALQRAAQDETAEPAIGAAPAAEAPAELQGVRIAAAFLPATYFALSLIGIALYGLNEKTLKAMATETR